LIKTFLTGVCPVGEKGSYTRKVTLGFSPVQEPGFCPYFQFLSSNYKFLEE